MKSKDSDSVRRSSRLKNKIVSVFKRGGKGKAPKKGKVNSSSTKTVQNTKAKPASSPVVSASNDVHKNVKPKVDEPKNVPTVRRSPRNSASRKKSANGSAAKSTKATPARKPSENHEDNPLVSTANATPASIIQEKGTNGHAIADNAANGVSSLELTKAQKKELYRKRKRADSRKRKSDWERQTKRIINEEKNDDRNKVKVHRCRFLELQPDAIHVISSRPSEDSQVAIARAGGAIELWSLADGWQRHNVIPGKSTSAEPEESRIRGLVWKKNVNGGWRLFGARLDGCVFEVDLVRLDYKETLESYGGAVWTIDLNCTNETLAVGCEDGRVRLLDVSEDKGIEYLSAFRYNAQGRILCLSWHPSLENVLWTGGIDGILRKWDATTGSVLTQMTVETYGYRPPFVWSLLSLKNDTVVTGDSLGRVQVWDGSTATSSLLQSFQEHMADVLSLSKSEDESIVFASGMDSKVSKFSFEKSQKRWVYSHSQRPHSHDVLSLETMKWKGDEVLLSGGLDTQLCWWTSTKNFSRIRPIKLGPFSHSDTFIQFSDKITCGDSSWWLMMVQHSRHVELFKLPDADHPHTRYPIERIVSTSHDMVISRQNGVRVPEKLAELRLSQRKHLRAAALSADGSTLAISDDSGLRLFSITSELDASTKEPKHGLKRLAFFEAEDFEERCVPVKLAFGGCAKADSLVLVCALQSGNIHVLEDLAIKSTPRARCSLTKPPSAAAAVTALEVSPTGKWVIVTYQGNDPTVFSLESNQVHSKIPRGFIGHSEPASMKVVMDGKRALLFLLCNNNRFYFYDLEARGMTSWTLENSCKIPQEIVGNSGRLNGVTFSSRDQYKRFCFWSSSFLCFGNLDAPMVLDDGRKHEQDQSCGLKLNKLYRPLVYARYLSNSEMVVVEAPWLSIMKRFTDPLSRKRYGGK